MTKGELKSSLRSDEEIFHDSGVIATSPLRKHWLLDPETSFLNHGSFGACPRAVLKAQQDLREELESDPVHFFLHRYEAKLMVARQRIAEFVGARPEHLAFVRNATTGVNAVLGSLQLTEGDELVTTDQCYNACRNAMAALCARSGATLKVIPISLPVRDPAEVVDQIEAGCGPRCRLALIDHITSPTGMVMPIQTITTRLEAKGVRVLVDGAHGPGMMALDLEKLGASYYVGNLHKWLCAPKGAGILWAREDRRVDLHPAVISHGYNSPRSRDPFLEEFDWTGTDDPTPWLSAPVAIDLVASLMDGGWEAVWAHNRRLALEARRILNARLEQSPICPESMIACLSAVRLPTCTLPQQRAALEVDPLQRRLWERHRIQVPVFPSPDGSGTLLRVSAHVYNTEAEYQHLAEAMEEALRDMSLP